MPAPITAMRNLRAMPGLSIPASAAETYRSFGAP
jgi:hypothetical protein